MKLRCLLLAVSLVLGVPLAAQVVGSANGTAGATGAVPGSTINVQNNGASTFVLTTNTTGSPASVSVEIDGSTDNGVTYAICGSAIAVNTISSTSCTGAVGTYDHIQVNITALSPGGSVVWALQAIQPEAAFSGTSNVNVAQVGGTATATGNGATNAGTQRVTISSDSTGLIKVQGAQAVGAVATNNPVMAGGVKTGSPGTIGYVQLTGGGVNIIGPAPGNTGISLGSSVTPISSASSESNHVFKASSGALYDMSITTGATAGFLMIFNATSAPVDGAVTPVYCYNIAANNSIGISWGTFGADFNTGITVVFSSTGCFTKTASATAFFVGRIE